MAVTTETDFGVETPLIVGVEFEPPVLLLPDEPVETVLLPDVLVELVLPEPVVVEPPPHPPRTIASARAHARHDHVLKDIQHSSMISEAA